MNVAFKLLLYDGKIAEGTARVRCPPDHEHLFSKALS